MTYLLILLPLFALGMTVLNLLTWPRRGHKGGKSPSAASVSVLIPARDEAHTIEACLRSVLDSTVQATEVLVYDDGSTDGTAQRVRRVQEDAPQVRLMSGRELPSGWVGKPHACHRLAEQAQGTYYLFIDADTRLAPRAIEELVAMHARYEADVLTAVPRQRMSSFAERLVMPLLHLTYTSWFPLILTYLSRDPRFLAANGQLLSVHREAYASMSGFRAVRDAVVDDMAFCRRAKERGLRVVFADAHQLSTCRMYDGMAGIWSGFSKNLYLGLGAQPLALVTVVLLYLATFVAPWAALGAGLWGAQQWLLPALIAVSANVLQRLAHVLRHAHPISGLILTPLAALVFVAIAINSWRWTRNGTVRWRGRSYGVLTAGPQSALALAPDKEIS